jgi:hypothetical protein
MARHTTFIVLHKSSFLNFVVVFFFFFLFLFAFSLSCVVCWAEQKRPQFEADRNRLHLFNRSTKTTTELAAQWTLSPSAAVWTHDSTQVCLSPSLPLSPPSPSL